MRPGHKPFELTAFLVRLVWLGALEDGAQDEQALGTGVDDVVLDLRVLQREVNGLTVVSVMHLTLPQSN